MKPSARIQEIFTDSQGSFDKDKILKPMEAIMQYLDEEYEKEQQRLQKIVQV